MKEKLVSIIIPTYKRSEMLVRAIDSCLNQSYKNIEIILVDDNDPKSEFRKLTKKKISQYLNLNNFKYIENSSNMGGCVARNNGVKHCQGEYICFLDDDDYFYKEKIKKQLNYMLMNELDVSFTASRTYDERTKEIIKEKRYFNFTENTNYLKYHLVEMIVSPQTFMLKKTAFEAVGGFDDVLAGHEFYLIYKLIKANSKIGYLDEILTCINIHSGERITTNQNKLLAEKELYLLKKTYFDILNFGERRFVRYIYKYNSWQHYRKSCKIRATILLGFIIFTHPFLLFKRKIMKKENKV